jgi:cytoskeletal protein CcmA (bactofilin family)
MFHRNKEKLESFIGNNSHFNGDVNTKGTLRIDGTMEGNVNADWVILGEKATLKGSISARGIIVGGKVEGNLKAKEIVEIKSKGIISGDVATNKLSIVEGAVFNGKAAMEKEEPKIVEFQVKEH